MIGKVVRVLWADICGMSGWQDPNRLVSPIKCTTYGTLIRFDRKLVVISGSFNELGQVGDVTVIPRPNVVEVTEMAERKQR